MLLYVYVTFGVLDLKKEEREQSRTLFWKRKFDIRVTRARRKWVDAAGLQGYRPDIHPPQLCQLFWNRRLVCFVQQARLGHGLAGEERHPGRVDPLHGYVLELARAPICVVYNTFFFLLHPSLIQWPDSHPLFFGLV